MNLILAADENWAIGKGNRLLFRLPPDMGFFKAKTTGGVVIMGRKTLESLPGGKPLKDRVNIVLSRNPEYSPEYNPEGIVCGSLPELAALLKQLSYKPDMVWVIGGAEIYNLLAPYCREALVTRILTIAGGADCWAPDLDKSGGWELAERGALQTWEGLRFRFDRYINMMPQDLPGQTDSSQGCLL
jgi:dihydrofolate reductase